MVANDGIQIHFFEFKQLDLRLNYGQVLPTDNIDEQYRLPRASCLTSMPAINHVLDPDGNLLTFVQGKQY